MRFDNSKRRWTKGAPGGLDNMKATLVGYLHDFEDAVMARRQDDPDTSGISATAREIRAVMGRLRNRLREQTHIGELTWPQVQVLTWLEREGPATVTTLARAHGMRPQSMGETLALLKKAGLVSGAPDAADGRQTLLSLTPRCRDFITAKRAEREDWLLQSIRDKFTPAEQKQLAIGVELLKRLVETSPLEITRGKS